jgi:hypothetical protein
MAWAVEFESKVGRFYPRGNFLELRERLRTYFAQEMSAEEKALFGHDVNYRGWVFDKFTREIGILRPGDRAMRTLPRDHEWPRIFQADSTIRGLGSAMQTTNSVLFVDEAMKGLIEALEPGIHHFRPITLLQPTSEVFPGTYFTMIIGQFRDSFIPDPETEGTLWNRSSYLGSDNVERFSGAYTLFPKPPQVATYAEAYALVPFSSAIVAGAHLWRERNLIAADFFISDTLHDAIKKAKLKIPPQFKGKEI